jgi:hypothetical protein
MCTRSPLHGLAAWLLLASAATAASCSKDSDDSWSHVAGQADGGDAKVTDVQGDLGSDSPEAASDAATTEGGGDAQEDDGSGDASDAPAPAPIRALLDVIQDDTAAVASITANAGFSTVYETSLDVQPGDVLRITGQVEITNDYQDPVRGLLQLFVDGAAVSPPSSQNDIVSGGHHMPLWADARWAASQAQTVAIQARYAASRSDASPDVKVEDGYGHLLVEHYRTFPSRVGAGAAGARGLALVVTDVQEDAASFGGLFNKRTIAYSVHVPTQTSDLVRLWGQATSGYNGTSIEMHGQGLFVDGDTRVSPWSTENTYWDVQTVPLFTDAVHTATAAAHDYGVSMHGVLDLGGPIVAGGGQLQAMVFRKADLLPSPWGLADSLEASGPAGADTLVANTGWKDVLVLPIGKAAGGDIIRVTGFVQLARTGTFALGIQCAANIVTWGASAAPATSPRFDKYVTQQLEALPLRVQQVLSAPSADDFQTRIAVQCNRDGDNPELEIVGGSVHLIAERFAP